MSATSPTSPTPYSPGNTDLVLLIGRIALVLLFPISGYFKIMQWPGIVTLLTTQGAPLPMLGGMLATPELVFTGAPDGNVMALDAKTLDPVWNFQTGAGVNAPPMAFSVDGKEYIALLVGLGGAWDKWYVDGTPELKSLQPGSTLYVFAVD